MKAISAALLCLCLQCLSANASAADGDFTLGDLRQVCQDPGKETHTVCRFYIFGVSQGIALGMDMADGKTKGGRTCIPDGTSSPALESAIKKRMGELLTVYPNDAKLEASGAIGALLVNLFPCRPGN